MNIYINTYTQIDTHKNTYYTLKNKRDKNTYYIHSKINVIKILIIYTQK